MSGSSWPARDRRRTRVAPSGRRCWWRPGPPAPLGAPRALPGTRGQWVSSLAGRGTTVAVVTATMYYRGRPGRTLWIKRGGRGFRRVLTIRPGTFARDTAVAVGPRGDVLVVWQEQRAIRARHVGRGGRVGPERTLGRGVQSALQANLASGRMEVAWMSQRVGRGRRPHAGAGRLRQRPARRPLRAPAHRRPLLAHRHRPLRQAPRRAPRARGRRPLGAGLDGLRRRRASACARPR